MKGFINVIKPKGMSSAGVVSAVKKKFHCPCGHMGTLDPMASGVLPVGIGKTSRLFDYLLDKEKVYKANFRFGITTDTLDTTGKVVYTTDYIPSIGEIENNLKRFIGKIEQVPPNYSAKCIDGKRGYQLARKGVEFSIPAKKVEVLDFVCLGKVAENEYSFTIKCKGGTYIRSLARDLGESVNSLAVMSELERTESGIFNLSNGVLLEELKNSISPERYLIPPDLAVNFPKAVLSSVQATRILNGLFDFGLGKDGLYRVYCEKEFWGIGEEKDGILRMKAYVR